MSVIVSVSEVLSLLVGREADEMGQMGEKNGLLIDFDKLTWSEAKSVQRGIETPSCVMTQRSTSERMVCDVAASHN